MTTEINYSTKSKALKAVKMDGNNLKFCSPELQNDAAVILTAVKNYSSSFEFASTELKSNKNFIIYAINEGINPFGLIAFANISIQSDLEVITLALEKNHNGLVFIYAKGEAALNKDLAAKALVKWGLKGGTDHISLWKRLNPALKEFFPKDSFYEKAQSYLYQLEQEKQAKSISGGSTEEDGVVW